MSSDWPAPFQPVGLPPPPPPPMPAPGAPVRRSRIGWFLAGGIVVAGIAALIFVALNVCPGCFGMARASPSPSSTAVARASASPTLTALPTTTSIPSPTVAGTPTIGPGTTPGSSASIGPGSSVPPDIAAQINAVISQMPAIRELDPLRDVPYQMVTRDQFKADLQTMFDDEVDLTVLGAQQRLYQRLGLLPADADLRQLLLDLNGGAVAAYYRPDTGTFYVIESDQPFGPIDRIYVAHEYTHALQDQHFDLQSTRITDPAEGDAALAQLAVIEGDASTAMMLWAEQNLTLEELFEILTGSLNGTDQQTLNGMPPILSRQLTFPYAEGMSFVTGLQQAGGWAAVNTAVQHPPLSTELILHPDKYDAHEEPVSVSLPDPTAALGGGWAQVDAETVGELSMQVFVAGGEEPPQTLPGLPGGEWPHAEAAAGWGGDRIYEWEGPDGAWAIGWISAWDTAGDADEFAARVDELKPGFGGPAQVDRADHNGVRLLVASDAPTLGVLATALH